MKALAQNEAVGILIDQNASLDQGVFVDFFGVRSPRESMFCVSIQSWK
ncbi:MAG: hypothetical protein ABJF23_06405 [Bryobacteraceae bacterium]